MNRLGYAHVLCLLTIVSLAMFSGVAGADTSVGVKSGEWAKYNVSEPSITGVGVTIWENITVNDVSGTVVSATLKFSSSLSNYTSTNDYTIDLASDCWVEGFPLIASANMTAGSIVPGGSSAGDISVNETTQYQGRDAAHVTITLTDERDEAYWDRQTGLLLKLSYEDPSNSSNNITVEIDSTSIWSGGGLLLGLSSQLLIIIIIVVVVVALGAGALMMRRRKPQTTAVSPPSVQPPPPPPPPT